MYRPCNRCGKESRYYLNNVRNKYLDNVKRPTYHQICDECYKKFVEHMTEAFDEFFCEDKEQEDDNT